ncbi:MAG TPA: D-alanine--D-alanine ligase [Candidatus Paceibacterota bacterium]|nr:D-alanine--D-alanine ligase [Candidatus Paceibacterota bacterium]
MTHLIRVGVLRGGPSSEYDVSLKTGASVLKHLPEDRYLPVDVFITKDGRWVVSGVEMLPSGIADHVDVVWNALHGAYGEDGKVQRILESIGIPYTGSRVVPSALGMHKEHAKRQFSRAGLRTPRGIVVERDADLSEAAFDIFLAWDLPLVVKPVSGGSSVATTIAHDLATLYDGLLDAAEYGDILVEEMLLGREATCAVVDLGQGKHAALFPIEIIPPEENDFFDYDAKYSGKSREVCPGDFSLADIAEIRKASITAHRALGLRHYSRSDFIVTPEGPYILETNTLPGLTEESLLPKALKASNVDLPSFLDHVLGLTLEEAR